MRRKRSPDKKLKKLIGTLGPGLITGSADDDPSGIATYSQAGAAFQYGLLWTVWLQLPLMIAVQYTCARIGIVSGRDLGRVVREHYPVWLLWIAAILLAIANTVTAGADLAAVGAAARMIAHVPDRVAVSIAALALITVLVFGSYDVIASVLKWLTLALLAYMVSGLLAHPAWLDVLRRSVVPHVEFSRKYLALFVAVFGTTISPYMFVWQSGEEVDESKRKDDGVHGAKSPTLADKLRNARNDTAIGMGFSQVIGWFVMMAAGATLFPAGHHDIQTANQAAQALAPLGHGLGRILFSVGIIGTGLLAIPTLVGATAFAVAGLARTPAGMSRSPRQSKLFNATIAVGVGVAAALALSGMSPVGMLLASAVVNGALAGPLLVIVLLVANNRDVMGDRGNGRLLNVLVLAAAVIMGLSSLWLGGMWIASHF